MKKIIVTLLTAVIAFSFSAVVLASTDVAHGSKKLTRQLVLSEEPPPPEPSEPAPPSEPVPEPEPAPAPEPEPK